MPNWKKVVVSGSNAVLNSVTASFTGSLTGSLFGTASYALTASFALNGGGGGAAFPYVGAAVITGSLIVSGANGGIDTSLTNPALYSGDGNTAVVFGTNRKWLNDANSTTVVDWEVQSLNDSLAAPSIDWTNRILYEPGGAYEALNYSTSASVSSQLYYNNIIPAQVQRQLAEAPTHAGQIIQASVDVSTVLYNLVYLDTDGVWKPLKNLPTVSTKMLGICVDTAGYVLIEGDVGVSDDNTKGAYVIGADHGLPIYISGTNGVMTTTVPTSGVVRILGHVYYNSTTDVNWWTMKFRPSTDWYEI
jgi:hypothetical protein